VLWGNTAELQYGDEFLPWGIQEVLHAMRPILRQQDGPSNQELGVATQRGRDDVREDRRMSDAPQPVPSPRRTSYRALAEAVRRSRSADHRRLFSRNSELKRQIELLEEAAQALEAMEPIHDSGDSFDRLGDVARRVVDGIGGKT